MNSSVLIEIIGDAKSHNTYLSKYNLNKLYLKKIISEKVKHGFLKEIGLLEMYSKHEFILCNLEKNFSCRIEILDQDMIFSPMDWVRGKKLIAELERINTFL